MPSTCGRRRHTSVDVVGAKDISAAGLEPVSVGLHPAEVISRSQRKYGRTIVQRLPNFFVIGAPRSGTTSLYEYLKVHPEIFMSPVKEPDFFIKPSLDAALVHVN